MGNLEPCFDAGFLNPSFALHKCAYLAISGLGIDDPFTDTFGK